jgi:hypothetical protein
VPRVGAPLRTQSKFVLQKFDGNTAVSFSAESMVSDQPHAPATLTVRKGSYLSIILEAV